MAPEIAARAFDTFFTTKAAGRGTGLGLAVCRTVVERLGGQIVLETRPGEGCRCDVVLPKRITMPATDRRAADPATVT